MEDKFPCQRHEEQIKTLFKRVDNMDKLNETIHNLDKNMALQTKMMEHVVEHNSKQDAIMVQISSNLTELNNGYKDLSKEVAEVRGEVSEVKGDIKDVSKRVDENEEKSKIDIWYFKRYIPYLILLGAGYLIANIDKFMK